MNNAAMVEHALEEAREGLISGDPAGMTVAAEALGKAEAGLQDLQLVNPGQLQRVQRRIRRLERLLEGSRSIHAGLARIANAVDDAVANYDRQGAPAPVPEQVPSVTLRG